MRRARVRRLEAGTPVRTRPQPVPARLQEEAPAFLLRRAREEGAEWRAADGNRSEVEQIGQEAFAPTFGIAAVIVVILAARAVILAVVILAAGGLGT